MEREQQSRPSLWGYGIAAVYTIFALATLSFVAFTMTQKVELVAPDYYAQEVSYEQQINRQRQSNTLAQPVTCVVEGAAIKLQFPAPTAGIRGTIKLYRPSESALDQEYEIALAADGSQSLPTTKLASGWWRVKVNWAAEGREFYHEFIVEI